MLGYLKMKYPRGEQTFVPTELMKEFKSFDMVEEPENDILLSAKICFQYENTSKGLVRLLKVFFNKLIDEMDSKFNSFQELLEEEMFKISFG